MYHSMNRRQFITKCALGVAAFQVVPRHILGGKNYISANERINVGVIGCGGISGVHQDIIRRDNRLRCVSVCDVIQDRRDKFSASYFPDAAKYNDFRELIARPDIDIVHIATPPHWHAAMVVAAARAGKDIFGEKPMTRTIGEIPQCVNAVKQYKRIFRINTWFRIAGNDYYEMGASEKIKKLCMHKMLGWPLTITVRQGSPICRWKFSDWGVGRFNMQPEQIPEGTDYDLWLGPAQKRFYNKDFVANFRGYWDYDGGCLADMGQHFLDPIQYFLGKDNEAPVEVEAETTEPAHPFVIKVNWKRITFRYADGCKIVVESELAENPDGKTNPADQPFIEGPNGKLYRNCRTDPKDLATEVDRMPDPPTQNTDFVRCVMDRKPFALNENSSAYSMLLVHLANTSIRTGRKVQFNTVAWKFINDPGADRLIHQPVRAPWDRYL